MAKAGRSLGEGGIKTIAVNKKARHRFHIEDTVEAGLVLLGSEVKSLRGGRVSITEGYVRLEDGEAFLVDVHVPPYEQANRQNHDPLRPRKLLLHKKEIQRLIGKISRQGYTLVPMRLYFRRGRAKLEIGLGRGKKLHDKRHDQKAKDARREMDRARKPR
ncbi:MAG: SsrA-binding protein [Rickettsiales bacterium]|nr:SsrA-binding protein [Rickettsiales bacterium]